MTVEPNKLSLQLTQEKSYIQDNNCEGKSTESQLPYCDPCHLIIYQLYFRVVVHNVHIFLFKLILLYLVRIHPKYISPPSLLFLLLLPSGIPFPFDSRGDPIRRGNIRFFLFLYWSLLKFRESTCFALFLLLSKLTLVLPGLCSLNLSEFLMMLCFFLGIRRFRGFFHDYSFPLTPFSMSSLQSERSISF